MCKHRNPYDQPIFLQLPKKKKVIIGAEPEKANVMVMACCGNSESDKYGLFVNPVIATCEKFEEDKT